MASLLAGVERKLTHLFPLEHCTLARETKQCLEACLALFRGAK